MSSRLIQHTLAHVAEQAKKIGPVTTPYSKAAEMVESYNRRHPKDRIPRSTLDLGHYLGD